MKSSKNYDVVIVGAGFSGIYAAWRLVQEGRRVALIEASESVGGNLKATKWKNYWLDNGTHNFDLRNPLAEAFFLDIMKDHSQIWTDCSWASTTAKTWTYGFEMPDFGKDNPNLAAQATNELQLIKDASLPSNEADSYIDAYAANYGVSLAGAMYPLAQKFTGSDPKVFSVDANQALDIFSRPKLGTDQDMIRLKSDSSFWNERLGVSLLSGDDRFSGANRTLKFGYPSQNGLQDFCVRAHERLLELGVNIKLKSRVETIKNDNRFIEVITTNGSFTTERVFWSLPEIGLHKILNTGSDLSDAFTPVGTCIFAFEVFEHDIQGPNYLHDFSVDRVGFRYNKIGVYSRQTQSDGKTVVMAEVPTHPSKISKIVTDGTANLVWKGMVDSGFISRDSKLLDSTQWSLPVAFVVPNTGWREKYNQSSHLLKDQTPNIRTISFGYNGRSPFMAFYESQLHSTL